MKRNKGLTSLDLTIPVPSNYRTDPQRSNNTETIHTNTDDLSKIATSSRPKLDVLRTNSPTFKRLTGVRIKLEKYVALKANTISFSQESMHETTNHDKQSITNVRISSSSQKRIKSKTSSGTGPLDKITYEKSWTHNGNVKQKCSLEIWLPKPDSDDEEVNTGRTTSPDPNIIRNKSQSPQSIPVKSRLSNIIKLPANIEIKSLDETSLKKSEARIIPRVYHYGEYLADQSEERRRSSKSGNTIKSDDNGLNKNIKRQRTSLHFRRLSSTTNSTEQTAQSAPSGSPMTSKNLLLNIKQTHSDHETKGTSGSTNSSMINDLMRKYSMIKKSHQELTQPKLQLEKPHHDSKQNTHIIKENSLPSPPPSDSASYTSSDHPMVSGRKLLRDTSASQSAEDNNNNNNNNTNTKLVDPRSSHRKSAYSDIYPQARLFSLVNHLQHRRTSACMPAAILPAVIGKKNEDPFRSFQRSKTLDVVFTVPIDNSNKIPTRLPTQPDSPQNVPNSSNLVQRTTNRNGQISSRISKRSVPPSSHTLRSEQQQQQQTSQPLVQLVQYQNIQKSAQRYHHSAHLSSSSTTTDVSTNKVLVHLKYSNSSSPDRNCLIPE